jgi:hypothetical protein
MNSNSDIEKAFILFNNDSTKSNYKILIAGNNFLVFYNRFLLNTPVCSPRSQIDYRSIWRCQRVEHGGEKKKTS